MKREEARTEILKIMALARNTELNADKATKAKLTMALQRIADQLADLANKLSVA